MKDDHLITALQRALARFGSPELPPDAGDDAVHRSRRPAGSGVLGARTPGWVSIGEIEASQPPNSYPRLGRREIKVRCRELAAQPDSPVAKVRSQGLRTWVLVAAPPHGDGRTASNRSVEADSAGKDVQGPRRGEDGDGRSDLGEADLRWVGDVDQPATLAVDVDLDLPDRA